MMKKKKMYIAPLLEMIPVGLPSILAGTNSAMSTDGRTGEIAGGGEGGVPIDAGDSDEGLSRRGGGFWDDDF